MLISFTDVVLKGSFYCPAYKHYNKNVTVTCDRCKKDNLPCCIGYGEMDLCLKCADMIAQSISPAGSIGTIKSTCETSPVCFAHTVDSVLQSPMHSYTMNKASMRSPDTSY